MKKIFFIIGLLIAAQFSFAQPDNQFSVSAEGQIFTVSKSIKGYEYITMNVNTWNMIASGTTFTSENLSGILQFILLKIADTMEGNCLSGIGFSCSISLTKSRAACPKIINNIYRFCRATIHKNKSESIELVFLDDIDWEDLIKN